MSAMVESHPIDIENHDDDDTNNDTMNTNPYYEPSWEPGVAERIKALLLEKEQQSSPSAVADSDIHQPPPAPLLVGLVGVAGSGSTIAGFVLATLLEQEGYPTKVLPQDGYHYPLDILQTFPDADDAIYRRGAPDTLNPQAIIRDLKLVKEIHDTSNHSNNNNNNNNNSGDEADNEEPKLLRFPGFDYAKGDTEAGKHTFDPSRHRILIVEGSYLLYDQDGWEGVRDLLDFSVFLDCNIDHCLERLKIRNQQCWGGYFSSAQQQVEERCEAVDRPQAMLVQDTKQRADLIVPVNSTAPVATRTSEADGFASSATGTPAGVRPINPMAANSSQLLDALALEPQQQHDDREHFKMLDAGSRANSYLSMASFENQNSDFAATNGNGATVASTLSTTEQQQQPEAKTSQFIGTWEADMANRIQKQVDESSNDDLPYMVALVGCPGSGKSVSAFLLAKLLEDAGYRTMVCPHDGYHYPLDYLQTFPDAEDAIYRRGAPDTFDPQALLRDLKRIRGGRSAAEDEDDQQQQQQDETLIKLPAFDHAKGDPEPDTHIFDRNNHKIVLCEGLYLLHDSDGWSEVADVFDLKLFMASDLEVCIERVKIRNQCIPGYTLEEILERCEKVDRVNALTVMRSEARADIVVQSAAFH